MASLLGAPQLSVGSIAPMGAVRPPMGIDSLTIHLAGMSKHQLYEVLNHMKVGLHNLPSGLLVNLHWRVHGSNMSLVIAELHSAEPATGPSSFDIKSTTCEGSISGAKSLVCRSVMKLKILKMLT